MKLSKHKADILERAMGKGYRQSGVSNWLLGCAFK